MKLDAVYETKQNYICIRTEQEFKHSAVESSIYIWFSFSSFFSLLDKPKTLNYTYFQLTTFLSRMALTLYTTLNNCWLCAFSLLSHGWINFMPKKCSTFGSSLIDTFKNSIFIKGGDSCKWPKMNTIYLRL